MSDARTSSEIERAGMKPWLKKTIAVVVTLLVLVITYFVLAAFLPRWWAQRIAGLAEGGFSRGILWGLLFGILCTAIPLVLLVWVWQVRGWKFGRGVQIALTVVALVVAIPNLMTLSVVLGGGNAAHAGERIMDVDAPGFRGASLVGAIIGVLVFALLVVAVVRYRKRGKDLRAARADLERKAADADGHGTDRAGGAGAAEGRPPEDSSRGPVDR
ncbi:hypothetical protein [Rhodococcus artemisiae]|uniref:Permease n=1 Tax=Rhodococcus artemisiae TaxID=714159 RepID=A0ABU7LGE5_9NOCA|nr:hypothetical protein [Rhodococcus artemisiae]MEE2060628.1 hypothetical protein [Rhodococcus artemisiae]